MKRISALIRVSAGALLLPSLVSSVLAQDSNSPQSRGVEIPSSSTEPLPASYGRRHALVMGINDYDDPAFPDLGYAVADARAIAKQLVDRFGFEADRVRLVLNEDARKESLERELQNWACDEDAIGEEDLLLVFFAGHGVTRRYAGGTKAKGYLVPVDARTRSDGKTDWGSLVAMSDLEEISELIPAKHTLFLLDCCFGGLVVSRAAPPVAAGLSNRARQVITAGGEDQTVLDAGGSGHSVFTQEVLDALGGDADLDNDQVITFGELFNHVGRTVEAMTSGRQTPLQATFPDHGGGNVALFSPDITPGKQTAGDRLEELRVGLDEAYELLGRFEDVMIAQGLLKNAEELWPRRPPLIPGYREWLAQAKDLLHRRPEHQSWLQRTRQEAYLSQVVAGLIEEGEGTEPDWEQVEPALQFRFKVFTELLQDLQEVEKRIPDIAARLEMASTIWRRSIGDHQDDWDDAAFFLSESVTYNHLDLEPQLGLVPLGPDPESGLWEFWHVESGTRPIRDEASGKLLMTGESGMVLVLLPGGTFPMGAQSEDPDGPNYDGDARSDEGPVHEVRLGPFFLSKFEMTQGQWLQIMGENPSYWKEDNSVAPALHPVEQVSWEDCRRTLLRVGLVLPTEAQWEYGARAGSRTPWWTGRERETLPEAANLADLSYERSFRGIRRWEDWDDGYDVHAPVGSLRANAFGLHDVAGNVWEWCQDWYGGYNLEVMNETGQRADEVQEGSRDRVFRGGSFDVTASYARSAYRVRSAPEFRINNLGVRPARVRD
jgi:formylglycine-generating enzyme required for sulfatase activity